MVLFNIFVAVPRLPLPVPDLHIPHAAFDQPACKEHLTALNSVAVSGQHVGRFAGNIKSIGGLRLHPPRQFHRCQPRLELWFVRPRLQVAAVQCRGQIELPLLHIAG